MGIAILILAAGASSRMGGADKLLEPAGGQPLLARVAARALATGAPVTVALPPDRPARRAALAGLPLQCITVADAAAGLSASLRAGLTALPPDAPVMLLLADLPDLTTADLMQMLAAAATDPGMIWRGTAADGTPGHPVILPADLRPALLRLRGDEGARPLLQAEAARLRLVPLPGRNATTDLDTPQDWADWRARTGDSGAQPGGSGATGAD